MAGLNTVRNSASSNVLSTISLLVNHVWRVGQIPQPRRRLRPAFRLRCRDRKYSRMRQSCSLRRRRCSGRGSLCRVADVEAFRVEVVERQRISG